MSMPSSQPEIVDFPELVIGVAAPIGVDLELLTASIGRALLEVDYTSEPLKLTAEMEKYKVLRPELIDEINKWQGKDIFNTYMRKMTEANALRKQYTDPALLARIAIYAIQAKRAARSGDATKPFPRHAYIVRQFKRPEEIELLRRVYGRRMILISAYASAEQRRRQIINRLQLEVSTQTLPSELSYKADQLIERDGAEDNESLGQALRETFHRADVFVHGLNRLEMDAMIDRFFQAFFGRTDIAPSKAEFGMYTAKSASLRSTDLARQVGAAVLSTEGDIITQSCNEVPRAHGGAYWDTEEPDFRDVKRGFDPNDTTKKEVLRDTIERLRNANYLSASLLDHGSDHEIVEFLIAREDLKKRIPEGVLASSKVMDLTEFGRVVHAEMSAICDAARIGRSIRGSTLYVTTFPCHNCAKHILASGVRRVVFIEPYTKSRAKELHPDEIEIEEETPEKVCFIPFMGISPHRYREIFQKGRRKNAEGRARTWYYGSPRPLIEGGSPPTFYEEETLALAPLLGAITPSDKTQHAVEE
jgi:deoxycytidylate deaminase